MLVTAKNDIRAFLSFAESLADGGREIARRNFRGITEFINKGDGTPVTATDCEIEEFYISRIVERFPDHGILGEESGAIAVDGEFVWVLDPIDGTKAFATGTPCFSSLIALCRHGQPILGIVDIPMTESRCIGAAGIATTFDGHPVAARPRSSLSDCVLSSAGVEFFYEAAPRAGFDRLQQAVQWTTYGAGSTAIPSLCRGLVDICLDGANLRTFDYCAFVPVIEGAGGRITDWQGNNLSLVTDPDARAPGVVATGDSNLHDKVLDCLQSGG